MLTFLFAWSFLSIAMCRMNENTLWLANLHAFYPLSPLLQSAHRDGSYPPCLFCHSAKREFSDPGPGLQILWSTRFHQVTVDYGSAGFLFHNVQDACMHSVCAEFNLLMGLRGLQPDALMIIFCEVVVMVWPRRQQLLCCLHMPLDQFGVCVLCSDGDNIPRTARIWTVFIRVAY